MKIIGRIGVVAATVLVVSTALAWDRKMMAGGACFPTIVNANGTTSPYIVDAAGILQNTGTSFANFTCPLVRDSVTNSNGLVGLTVTVSDTSSTSQVACTISSTDYLGNVVYSNTNTSGNVFNSGFFQINLSLPVSQGYGAYYLACNVAPNQKIISYAWTEVDEAP